MGSSNNTNNQNETRSFGERLGMDKKWVPGIETRRSADSMLSQPRNGKVDPHQRNRLEQTSKVMPSAKEATSTLETIMNSRQKQTERRVSFDEEDREIPHVGDISPVDKVPVDTTPVKDVDKHAQDSARNKSPSPEERAAEIHHKDELAWDHMFPVGVPLDEKALHEKKQAESEQKV